jgi:hypothetical protein
MGSARRQKRNCGILEIQTERPELIRAFLFVAREILFNTENTEGAEKSGRTDSLGFSLCPLCSLC